MGRAIITENIGAGLYKARPVYNDAAVNWELSQLRLAEQKYLPILLSAYRSKDLLAQEVAEAATGLNEVIKQWQAALLSKLEPVPPLIPPTVNNPETGEPWEDEDRAQDGPLLDAINAARGGAGVAALERDEKLDSVALKYLKYLAYSGRTGHIDEFGMRPEDRVYTGDFDAEAVEELLGYGEMSAAEAVANWLKSPDMRAYLLDPQFTLCGVAYKYAPSHSYGQLWIVELANPGTPPPEVEYPPDKKDPATEKLEDEAVKPLQKIEPPRIDDLAPKQLGEISQKYGVAIGKLRLAEREIARLLAEKLARDKRIAVLEGIIAAHQPMHVWCYVMDDTIAVGTEVDTLEVPGFWRKEGVAMTATLYKWLDDEDARKRIVATVEYAWNIAPATGYGETTGKLTPAEALTDAAVFVNAAIEPGHLRWRPRWRYGELTAINQANQATVLLNAESARLFDTEEPIEIVASVGLPCGCRYMQCDAEVFVVDGGTLIPDVQVLVAYSGTDRATSTVIGFRREPLPCPSGRVSWGYAGF